MVLVVFATIAKSTRCKLQFSIQRIIAPELAISRSKWSKRSTHVLMKTRDLSDAPDRAHDGVLRLSSCFGIYAKASRL
jgi:hypothetical protein